MKKLLMIFLVLGSFLYAQKTPVKTVPKVGCILAQDGELIVNWQGKNNTNGVFQKVEYTAIQKEGINFKEIFVGSSIKFSSQGSPITLKIIGIKANPRVKPNPRTGTMKVNVLANGINKDINMNYVYDKNSMRAKGVADILGFETIDFETKIKAVLCNI